MSFKEKYKQQSKSLMTFQVFEGKKKQEWQSPSNIALIKYWGKKDYQIPQNPSVSFSLSRSHTKTEIIYEGDEKPGISIQFMFDGKHKPDFEKRIAKHLQILVEFLPFLNNLKLTIHSSNSFPHSSGIASSASAMSALALGLCSIERDLFGTLTNNDEFLKKASFIARMCSGSAARSVYGGFTIWGRDDYIPNSSDEIAIPINTEINPVFQDLNDSILITSPYKKSVSSAQGHYLMNGHPYAEARYKQAQINIQELTKVLKTGDTQKFITIVENEALSLHALMMASYPGFTLLNQNTWNIINTIRKFREANKLMLAFTLDAGPNVHLIYPEKNKKDIVDFISNDLTNYCHKQKWIDDKIGNGPFQIFINSL